MATDHRIYGGTDGKGLAFIKCSCGDTVIQKVPLADGVAWEELKQEHLSQV